MQSFLWRVMCAIVLLLGARLRLAASRQDLTPWIEGPKELSLEGVTFQLQPVGPSHTPEDLVVYLRSAMGQAAKYMEPFEDAYVAKDWMRFEHLPLFWVANRMNAYNTYLLLEKEAP